MTGLRVEPERLAAPGGLVADLLSGRSEARGLFPPNTLERIQEMQIGSRAPLPLSAAPFRCMSAGARDRLERLLAGEAVVVTTGQQPQLFGGPLFVLYKALSAAAIAGRIEAQIGRPCLAVFWVAADDHDWAEVASIGLPGDAHGRRRITLDPPPGWERRSVGPAPLPEATGKALNSFIDALDATGAGESWLETLRRAYVPGRPFTEAFADVLHGWLAGVPIALLDAAHPEVRRASLPMFLRVLEQHDAVEMALRQGWSSVAEAGYRPQLAHVPDALPLFVAGPGGRQRVRVTDGRAAVTPDVRSEEPLAGLRQRMEDDPTPFSPAAALRPALESTLLPVAATVLGPGELAYWAQLPQLFRVLDAALPAIHPRQSWRVVEPSVARLLDKTGVDVEELRDGGKAASEAVVERQRPRRVEDALRSLEGRIAEAFAALDGAIGDELPGLRSAVGKARRGASSTVGEFRRTLDASVRERARVAISQVQRAAGSLYPGGVPQERSVSPFVYLARHGSAFADLLRRTALDGHRGDSPG